MTKILGISGSLRRQSYNTALLQAAKSLVPAGVEFSVATLEGIPLYDGDVEQRDGLPTAVAQLKERIVNCDGLLLATPEYNNGVPGVFKNAIDWLSRPSTDIPKVFGGRRVAVVGASAGGFGTILAQNGWLPILKTLGTQQWAGGRLMVARSSKVFSETGAIVDEAVSKQLQDFLAGFVRFAK